MTGITWCPTDPTRCAWRIDGGEHGQRKRYHLSASGSGLGVRRNPAGLGGDRDAAERAEAVPVTTRYRGPVLRDRELAFGPLHRSAQSKQGFTTEKAENHEGLEGGGRLQAWGRGRYIQALGAKRIKHICRTHMAACVPRLPTLRGSRPSPC